MATPAGSKRKPAPAQLRLVSGRGARKDGVPTDSGGRPIPKGPSFTRAAPTKPDELSADASWLWDQVVEQMTTLGLLKPLDAAALEVVCETFARWREAVRMRRASGLLAENSQGRVTAPWIAIEKTSANEFRQWCAEFGFTPAAEKALAGEVGNVTSPGADPGNPF